MSQKEDAVPIEGGGQAQENAFPEVTDGEPIGIPVVGMGASAGGLEAMKDFLAATASNSGACFVFVQHLDPGHRSMLTELLGRCTAMPVLQAEDGMEVAADHVIIIPPDATLTIESGVLHLERPAPPRTHRTPIDTFFHSLAADQGDRAIAIILSGTGSDGTQGLKAVKEAGGFTLVQDPTTAKYDSMPRNAEATGLVDQVLSPASMPGCLVDYLNHLREEAKAGADDEPKRRLREELAKVCSLLRRSTGHDFRDYKEPTLIRRVQRRMQVLRIGEIEDYVKKLRDDPKEAKQLFRDLLVSVTGFFRDRAGFEALESKILEPLLANRDDDEAIRIWVPGCATGEEAYSIAMALKEKIDDQAKPLRLQIFATDIDEAALETARRASYPESIAAYVPERFLKRFFRIVGGEYQVSEEIRELCIFSTQSLIKDPPFSRLNMISCRNVLIYFKTELQNRLIPVFHYALRPGGFLFLGPSENVSRHGRLFETVDKKWRIFKRRDTDERPPVKFPLIDLVANERDRAREGITHRANKSKRDSIIALAERSVLDDLGPAFAVVGENRELIYSGGDIDPYLKLQKGDPSLEIVAIAHKSLRMDIRAVLHRAAAEQGDVVRENVSMETSEGRRRVTLLCRPLGEDQNAMRHYLIAFRDLGLVEPQAATSEEGDQDLGQIQALESELRSTKEYLQTTTEELESSNEELKSANEELMSMNEELQSSNEELETSKEELQSVNEELETVNVELASKVEELGRLNSDLQNLLESTQIATLFLDRGMRVRRFTPIAKEIFHLIDSDLGRSITDITARVESVDLATEVERVLTSLSPVEREVRLRNEDKTYLMRLLPYRTPGDVIDGVVATFVDVTRLEKVQQEVDALNRQLQNQVDDLEALLDLAPIGIAFADDPDCKTMRVNRYGAETMRLPSEAAAVDSPKARIRFVQNGNDILSDDLPLKKTWRNGEPVSGFRATYLYEDKPASELLMSSAPVFDSDGNVRLAIGIFSDVTRLAKAQQSAEIRAGQQDFLAKTGSLSLRGQDASELIALLPRQLAQMLNIDVAAILLQPSESSEFRLEAAHGLDLEKGAPVDGSFDSQASYTLQSAAPVIVERLLEERRFAVPPLLKDAGLTSGISIVIGDPEKPWGVLSVYTRAMRNFSADDVKFLQSVANVLAATLERDAWGQHQRLLLDELRHRVKNSLATVQAIAGLTFDRQSAATDLVQSFIARLQALATAHDLRLQSDWKDVDFGELIKRQIEPYAADGRVKLSGRSGVRLPANVAIEMAMLVHELATNAVKHGALGCENGSLDVNWSTTRSDENESIVFDWIEKSDVEPEEPVSKGVGTKLMEAISKQAHIKVDHKLAPEGFTCRIVIDREVSGTQ